MDLYLSICIYFYVCTCLYIDNQDPLKCFNCPLLYRSKEIIHINIKGK